ISARMSPLRLTSSRLSRGAKFVMPGTALVAASRILGSRRSQAEAIATLRSLRPDYLPRRSSSIQRPVKASRQTSRFRRSGAASAETPPGAAGEGSHVGSVFKEPNDSVTPSAPTSAPEPLHVATARSLPHRRPPPQKTKPVDPSSKEYKQTERKVISIIVGLPVLFVTSYFLYDRRKCSQRPRERSGY
ncbi:hypothetical protein C8A03DRAFT_16709, partial [Achaetomium macrosporum]